MFRFRWLHRMIRRRMSPIEPEKALKTREKLAIAYAIIAWQAFGLVAYYIVTGKSDWPDYFGLKSEEEKNMPKAVWHAKTLGIQRADVITYRGFTKVGEFEYVNEEPQNKDKSV